MLKYLYRPRRNIDQDESFVKGQTMFNLLKTIIRKLQPTVTLENIDMIEAPAGCNFERTHEIMSGDTVMFWDGELDSMEVGVFNYLVEWQTGTPSDYAVVTRWDGQVMKVRHESIELF